MGTTWLKILQNNGPKPQKVTPRAIILHTVRGQIKTSTRSGTSARAFGLLLKGIGRLKECFGAAGAGKGFHSTLVASF